MSANCITLYNDEGHSVRVKSNTDSENLFREKGFIHDANPVIEMRQEKASTASEAEIKAKDEAKAKAKARAKMLADAEAAAKKSKE